MPVTISRLRMSTVLMTPSSPYACGGRQLLELDIERTTYTLSIEERATHPDCLGS